MEEKLSTSKEKAGPSERFSGTTARPDRASGPVAKFPREPRSLLVVSSFAQNGTSDPWPLSFWL